METRGKSSGGRALWSWQASGWSSRSSSKLERCLTVMNSCCHVAYPQFVSNHTLLWSLCTFNMSFPAYKYFFFKGRVGNSKPCHFTLSVCLSEEPNLSL